MGAREPLPVLQSDRVLLRDFIDSDFVATHEYESDSKVVRYQSHGVRTAEESLAYIKKVREESSHEPRRLFDLAIVFKENEEVVGRCGLYVSNPELREATLWYVLNRHYWGRGLVPEAARVLLGFGFRSLGIHRVFVDCDPRNVASVRVAQKLGMRQEAHFHENAWIKGEWTDSVVYAILDREWV
jgi:[ribosomal protein S5]-alanine N-acetyltransferase